MRWLLLIAIVALQAASCGQTGPLQLPERSMMPAGAPLTATAAGQDAGR
jgi:predicted small lipoprotein YifL